MFPTKPAFLIISIITLLIPSCKNKPLKNTIDETATQIDSIKTVPPEFIDLLFAEHTIKQVNDLVTIPSSDPNSIWAKFIQVENLQKENKNDQAKTVLHQIVNDDSAESRTIAWAWNGLRELGEIPKTTKVLGIVLEVPQENVTEYLAVYSDHRARYINYSGSIAVWESEDKEMTKLSNDIISKSQNLIKERKLPLGRTKTKLDKVRFSFLTTAGIFQTENTFEELSQKQTEMGDLFSTAISILHLIVDRSTTK